MQSCPEDRPLVVQFCANDPEIFLEAIELTKHHKFQFDAVDLNLGCPQVIAKRGHFGAFLEDEWDLVSEIVGTAAAKSGVPITVKLRVFDDIGKTVEYAKMLEKAGAKMLTVHGRWVLNEM